MTQSGYVAIVGRPNVGKSTLMNRILGQKLSITSRKPQTTRHQIIGIWSEGEQQVVYVDTPGLHSDQHRAINRVMNQAARSSLHDVDAVIFVVDARRWTEEDERVLEQLETVNKPVILLVNKVDLVPDKEELFPLLEKLAAKREFHELVPASARKGRNTERLSQLVAELMPESEFHFDSEQLTDRPVKFLFAEMIREKVMRITGQELPYSSAVEIEAWDESEPGLIRIAAALLVERTGQKAILIGHKGNLLKEIGTQARLDMEKLMGCKVFLQLWVKVKSNWCDDERALRSLGYRENE